MNYTLISLLEYASQFKCYHWSKEEFDYLTDREKVQNPEQLIFGAKILCQNLVGKIWTFGNDDKAPGCGTCSCCKPGR